MQKIINRSWLTSPELQKKKKKNGIFMVTKPYCVFSGYIKEIVFYELLKFKRTTSVQKYLHQLGRLNDNLI
jgi:hypothetical protein